jgi:hypothetical protein
MLRWIVLAVLVVGLTIAVSFAAHYLPARTASQLTAGNGPAFPHLSGKEAPTNPGKAIIASGGDLVYEFGTMSTQAVGKKEWVIKNEGPGVIMLKQGKASCSCTIAGLAEGETATVKPGEETTVRLKWETRTHTGPYGQRAEVLVMNDPDRQAFEFSVRGTVSPALVTVPPESIEDYTNVSDGKSHSIYFAVFSPDRPSMQITGLETSRPDKIIASFKPLSPEEHEKIGVKEGGYKVEVELKPGIPLGELREAVVVKTDHPSQESLRMLINGHTVGPVSTSPDRLTISRVASSQGASRMLTIWVRGQEHTKFDVAEVPEHLQARIQPVEEKQAPANSDTHAKRYRLEVKVMPGTPSGLIDGSILLKTDHPQASEVRIPVNVTVTSAG